MNPELGAHQPSTSTLQVPVPNPTTSMSPITSPKTSMLPIQSLSPQCSPLVTPAMLYSSYPSSTLHTYYPNPPTSQNITHISTHISSPPLHFPSNLLPSASQSRVPMIRGTPSPISIDTNINAHTQSFVPYTSPLLSPLIFPQPFLLPFHVSHHTPPQTVQNTPTPHNSALFSPHYEPHTNQHFSPLLNNPLFRKFPMSIRSHHDSPIAHILSSPENRCSPPNNIYFPSSSYENHRSPTQPKAFTFENNRSPSSSYENCRSSTQTKTFLKITLPSTKDIFILTGKHDWGPWHTAVWTLIDCSNLLGHIHEHMLPDAVYDPDLEPSFPPIITRESLQHEKELYSEWWNHDKVASYILTSRLSPTALGSIPIVNSQLGQHRSARTIYTTLKNNYGAGDYSAVMAIETRLRRLRCIPARGGVRVAEYISTWRMLYNQMEAAGYPPST